MQLQNYKSAIELAAIGPKKKPKIVGGFRERCKQQHSGRLGVAQDHDDRITPQKQLADKPILVDRLLCFLTLARLGNLGIPWVGNMGKT